MSPSCSSCGSRGNQKRSNIIGTAGPFTVAGFLLAGRSESQFSSKPD
jgi:hypothetical protein